MSVEFRSSDLVGVHVALITPLLSDCKRNLRNSIDFKKAEKMIEDLIAQGVDGIVPTATTGQSPTVTPKQHLEFIKFVLDKVAGRVKVIAGAGSNCTRETIDMVGEIQKISQGTPCLCVTGYYNNPPQEGIQAHYEAIVEETGAPVVMYNVPGRTASYIEPETIIALAHNPKILGLKQSVNFADPGKFRDDTVRIARETASLDFTLVSGEDGWFLDILELGGKGIVSASANIPEAAKLFLEVHRRHFAGDSVAARQAQKALAPYISWVFARKSPIPLATMFNTPVFLPLVDFAATAGGQELVAQMEAWASKAAPSLQQWKA
ncbi:MAG: dihydrodipicolinate synthase [Fibrobacterota bacterium]